MGVVRTVLVPLMAPEGLIISLVILPVLVHIGQQLGTVLPLEDIRDIRVLTALVAVGLVGAVAVIGPSIAVRKRGSNMPKGKGPN